MVDLMTLIPPDLLGERLRAHREDRHVTLAELVDEAAALGLSFTKDQLVAVEIGTEELTDDHLEVVLDLYGIPVEYLEAAPTHFSIDIRVGDGSDGHTNHWIAQRMTRLGPSRAMHRALARYVALLYVMRRQTPGTLMALRSADVQMFADVYARPVAVIEEELQRLMAAAGGNPTWLDDVRDRVSLPSAGVLVGVADAGALVITAR